MTTIGKWLQASAIASAASFGAIASTGIAQADIVHSDDVIIQGSLCVGFDCVNGEVFGFDTIRLKENNLRIMFVDTSTTSSFPRRDWQLIANASASGGLSYFGVHDCGDSGGGASECGTRVFTIEGAADSDSLYIDTGGRVGFGTSTPVVELHAVDGDTPTLRLEQNGSSGFAAQTWDVAGNEANFFVRDVTGGSRLPLRIRPGAPTSSLDIAADGDVGLGTSSPDGPLHLSRNGLVFIALENTSGTTWNVQNNSDELRLTTADGPGIELALTTDGDLTITGEITTSGSCSVGCDRVFDADYDLPTIKEHAGMMWANKHLPAVGPTIEGRPMNLTKKVEGLLNELEKAHIYIVQLEDRVARLEDAPK